MPIGYNLQQPNGVVYKARVQDDAERKALVDMLCGNWFDYCSSHWQSDNHEQPFCPENRVKRFLDGMAYFLMVGDTKGITTDYKRMADGNREVPLSSCPHFIEERLYGGGASVPTEEDVQYLQRLKEELDVKAPKNTLSTVKPKVRDETRSDRIRKFEHDNGRPKEYIYCIVDTDGKFSYDGESFMVAQTNEKYAGKETKSGTLYDMDHVTVAIFKDGSRFYFDTEFYPLDGDVIPLP